MKRAQKIIGRILVGVVILALVLGAGVTYYFKSYLPNKIAPKSFPQIDGQINVPGLDDSVDVYRDHMGIPHIYAATSHDLFFAQGYIHAQDRFWQMDFWRHVGSGRVSEMFSSEVDTDTFLRTLGWRQTAEAEWNQLDPASKNILLAYTDGVNAYLKDHNDTALSLEYAVLDLLNPKYKIEKWTPVNSLTWGKAMAWDLRSNMGEEIQRAILLKTLSPDQVAELFPPYPQDNPVIVNNLIGQVSADAPGPTPALDIPMKTLATLNHNVSLLDPILGPTHRGIGSNSWVIGGALTTTGKPLFANDPHLSSQMPSIWYQVGLHCLKLTSDCPFDVAGFSFAGVPGVIIGHNNKITWGFTNVGPDVMDLYIEKVNPENPNQYEVNGKWVDFKTRKETINIAGSDPVEITVRSTRHGPVISESYGPLQNTNETHDPEFVPFKDKVGLTLPQNYVIALSWTALTPSTPFKAIWGFDKAQNWEQFREAAREFHVPAQNLLYADVDGNIGYQTPGDIPIRKKGNGTLPVPGWTDEYGWTGFIPFDALPYAFNPKEGYIATANNQIAPRDYSYLITYDWDYGFRARRIVNLIKTAPGKIDIPYIQSMQGDNYDMNAEVWVPIILKMDNQFSNPAEATAFDLLKNWDYQEKSDSAPAAIFQAFTNHLLQDTFNDDLPKDYWPDGGDRWIEVVRNLKADSPWWDDKTTTDVIETRDDMVKKSFNEAVAELEGTLGRDPTKWTWGAIHTITFKNGTLGKSGIFLIEDLFNRGPFATSGGKSIINATGWDVGKSYEVDWLPSMRMIVDLSNLNNSLTVHTTGQSGHAYSPHYFDMSEMWANIKYYPMWWNQDSVIKDSEGHLVLRP